MSGGETHLRESRHQSFTTTTVPLPPLNRTHTNLPSTDQNSLPSQVAPGRWEAFKNTDSRFPVKGNANDFLQQIMTRVPPPLTRVLAPPATSIFRERRAARPAARGPYLQIIAACARASRTMCRKPIPCHKRHVPQAAPWPCAAPRRAMQHWESRILVRTSRRGKNQPPHLARPRKTLTALA